MNHVKIKETFKSYGLLHGLLILYSLSSVCSKLAAKESFLSFRFCLFYGAVIIILLIYAVFWQQILTRMSLSAAFANKGVLLIWGMVWGTVLFQETITPKMLIGCAIVLLGIFLVVGEEKMGSYILLFLGSVFLSSVSQVILKKSAMEPHENKLKEYLNIKVILAYALFFMCTLFTVIAYRKVPLSLGPILEATSYVYIMLFGFFLFKEKMTLRKIVGNICIILGIVIFSI